MCFNAADVHDGVRQLQFSSCAVNHSRNHGCIVGGDLTRSRRRSLSFPPSSNSPSPVVAPPMFHPFSSPTLPFSPQIQQVVLGNHETTAFYSTGVYISRKCVMGGLGGVHKLMGWVGLGEEKWTHVHLCDSQLQKLSGTNYTWSP